MKLRSIQVAAFLLGMMATAAGAEVVLHYSFSDATQLPTVLDLGPNANDGTAGPAAVLSENIPVAGVPDGLGNRSLDATVTGDDGVVSAQSLSLSNDLIAAAGGFTYETWFNWNGGGNVNSIIDYAGTEKLVIPIADGGVVKMRFDSGSPDVDLGTAIAGQWHYAAVVFDTEGAGVNGGAITGTLRTYFDTLTPIETWDVTKAAFGDSLNRPIGIAKHPIGFGGDFFDGLVYEPKITLGALTTEELMFAGIQEMTWDVFGHADLTWESNANWIPSGPPTLSATATIPLSNMDTIVVTTPSAEARDLFVNGGGIEIAVDAMLTVASTPTFAETTSLTLKENANFTSLGGGSLALVTTTGSAAIDIRAGDATAATLDAAAGTFTKQGAGSLRLADLNAVSGTVLKVAGGTLTLPADDPLGGAGTVELAGGRLSVPAAQAGLMPGLAFGVVPGADNETDFPTATTVTVDLAETEMGIPADTTHVFTGLFYDEDNYASFQESIDDNALLIIDDVELFNDGAWDFAMEAFGFGLPINPDLDPGWHTIELRLGNGGGPGGVSGAAGAPQLGFGWDLFGGFDYVHPEDPGDGSLFQTPTYGPIDLSGATLVVTGDSILELITPQTATVGPVIMKSGVLTTIGAAEGIIFDQGVTIDEFATSIGFDPQTTTNYGAIANYSTQETLNIVKSGSSTWELDTVILGPIGSSNVIWEVAEGTLQVAGGEPLAGRPVLLTGGTLSVRDLSDEWAPLDGAVTRYSFDDPASLGNDDSGNGRHALAPDPLDGNPPSFSTDAKAGAGAAMFDGQAGLLTHLNADGETGVPGALADGSHTVLVWAKASPVPSGATFEYGLGFWTADGGNLIVAGGSDQYTVLHNPDGGGNNYWADSNILYRNDEWRLIGWTLDAENDVLSNVVDGLVAATNSSATEIPADGKFSIGQDWDGGATSNFYTGLFDELYVYDRALTPAEIAEFYGYQPVDMSGVDVTVAENSTIDLRAPNVVAFESLTLQDGILRTTGVAAGLTFTGTTIEAAEGAVVGLDVAVPTQLGPISVTGSDAVTFVKAGSGDLVLDQDNTDLTAATTIEAQDGRLIGLPNTTNPFGAATLKLDGGEIVLSSRDATAEYDNPIVVDSNSTLTAGTVGIGVADATVSLGSAASSVTLNGGTLALGTTDGYHLDVAGTISGPGKISVAEGNITLSGGGSTAGMTVTGGMVDVAADLQVEKLTLSGGTVATEESQLTVTQQALLGGVPYHLDAGSSFSLSGSDLGGSNGERLVTLSGGSLKIGFPTEPVAVDTVFHYSFTDGLMLPTVPDLGTGANDGVAGPAAILSENIPTVGVSGGLGNRALDGSVAGVDDGVVTSEALSLSNANIAAAGGFTYEAWFNWNGEGNINSIIDYAGTEKLTVQPGLGGDVRMGFDYGGSGGIILGNATPGQWHYAAVVFDSDGNTVNADGTLNGTVTTYFDGLDPMVTENVVKDPFGDSLNRMIGVGQHPNGYGGDYLDGLVFEPRVSLEPLGPGELLFVPDGANEVLDLSLTNVAVTADTTLTLYASSGATLGNVTLDQDTTLTITDASTSFGDIAVAGAATIDMGGSYLTIRAALLPSQLPATLTVKSPGVTFADGSTYMAALGSTAADQLAVDGIVEIRPNSTLQFAINGKDLFKAGTYTLISSQDLEEGLDGQFTTVGDLGKYVDEVTQGLLYEDQTLKLTLDFNLHPGDANLDTTTDVRDFNVWNTNKFTSDTDWTSGDFDGNGVTDVRDFNVWNTSKFTSVDAGAPMPGGQVPEPSTLVLLVLGLLAAAVGFRRRRQ